MEFLNPYQFIPIDTSATKTLYWKNREDLEKSTDPIFLLRHDYWHEQGLSGRITCELKSISPVVVGGRQTRGNKENPGVVEPYYHPDRGSGLPEDDRLAIPANSLRGMIGNVTEIISQSALRVLAKEEDTVYSQRKPPPGLKDIGLLFKDGDDYWIYPLKNPAVVADYENTSDPDTLFLRNEQTFHYEHNLRFVFANIQQRQRKPDLAKNLTHLCGLLFAKLLIVGSQAQSFKK
ncbi:MAG: hypothetical protein ACRESZ_05990 [Methylococcales bacterium]